MPNYSYECSKCKSRFELFFHIKDYVEKPRCTKCGSGKTNRCYILDVTTQIASVKKSDSELKTLGDLANRNRDKMTEDQKNDLHYKHNEYKYTSEETSLPKGMSRPKKHKKIKWR